MKVGIYFFVRTHSSFLDELLAQVPDDSEVDLFCTNSYKHLKSNKVNIHPVSLFKLLFKANSYDRIIIDEVTGRYLFWLPLFLFWRQNTYLVLHNLKSWIKPVFFSTVSGFLNSVLRRIIFIAFKHYIVVGTRMKSYGETHSKNKNFYFVPFGLSAKCCNVIKSEDDERLFIVVPGTVSSRRKYEWILGVLDDYTFESKVYFALLGKPGDEYGNRIIKYIKEREYSNISIFESYIPENVYNKYMNKADFILSDFDLDYKTLYGQIETYGETKETGVSFLLLSYEKPGLLPEGFQYMEELNTQIASFDSLESLKKILSEFSSKRDMIYKLGEKAVSNRALLASKVDNIFIDFKY